MFSTLFSPSRLHHLIGALLIGISTSSTMFVPLTSDAFWAGYRLVLIWESSGFYEYLKVVFSYSTGSQRPFGGVLNYVNWGISGRLAQEIGITWGAALWFTNFILFCLTLAYFSKMVASQRGINLNSSIIFLILALGFSAHFSTNALVYHDPFSMHVAYALCLILPINAFLHSLVFVTNKSKVHLYLSIFFVFLAINTSEANYPGALLVISFLTFSIIRNHKLFGLWQHFLHIATLLFTVLNLAFWLVLNQQGNAANYTGTQPNLNFTGMIKTVAVQLVSTLPLVSGFIQKNNVDEFLVLNSEKLDPSLDLSNKTVLILAIALLAVLSIAWRQIRLCLEARVSKSSKVLSNNFLALGIGILGSLPMVVIAVGLKSQIELVSNFTYYIGAPILCFTFLVIVIIRFRYLLLGNYYLTIALISLVALFQFTQNYDSAKAVNQKYNHLKLGQLALTNPRSLHSAEFCMAKSQIVLNDYAGLGKSVGNDLENYFFSFKPNGGRC